MNVKFLRKLVFILFLILLALILLTKCTSGKNYTKNTKTIIDSREYSDLSVDELKAKLGDPSNAEPWKLNNENGSFDVTTYSYQLEEYSLDFIADNTINKIVKMYYIPDNPVKFKDGKNKTDILKMVGIEKSETQKTLDNGITLKLKLEDPNIVGVEIHSIDSDTKTFGMVYIVFSPNYL